MPWHSVEKKRKQERNCEVINVVKFCLLTYEDTKAENLTYVGIITLSDLSQFILCLFEISNKLNYLLNLLSAIKI